MVKLKHVIIGSAFALIVLACMVLSFISIINGKDKIINVMAKEFSRQDSVLQQTTSLYSNAAYKRDSLTKVNTLLSKYRTLTDAMSYRDSIRKPLSFEVGETVHMKRDSSRVLVNDILVGGGKYEYYIKYLIEHKDKSTEIVPQEFLYK